MVLGVVGICLILLIIGEAVPAFRPAVSLLPDDETSSDTNVCYKDPVFGGVDLNHKSKEQHLGEGHGLEDRALHIMLRVTLSSQSHCFEGGAWSPL